MLLVARQCPRVIDSLELNAGPLGLLFLPEDVFRRKTNQLVRIVRIGLRVQVNDSTKEECWNCDEYYKSGQHAHRIVLTCETTTRVVNRLYSVGFRKYNKSGQHIVQCFVQCWLLMEEEQQSTCGESGWTSGPPTCLSISPTNIPIVFLGKICSK